MHSRDFLDTLISHTIHLIDKRLDYFDGEIYAHVSLLVLCFMMYHSLAYWSYWLRYTEHKKSCTGLFKIFKILCKLILQSV